MKPRHRSLAIVADVGVGPFHVGDEAMLVANLEALHKQEPDLRISVIGSNAPMAAALNDADGLFVSGGGNLSSSWPELLGQRVWLMREARRRGLPVVTGGQTIGPALTAGDRSALAEALTGAAHVGVRELPSAALALRLGVSPHRLSYQPDDAFFLAGHPPAAGKVPGLPDEPYAAITLDPSFAEASLGTFAAQLARFAAESELRLVFLPHVGPLGGLGEGDGRVGSALRRLLLAKGVECALLPVMPPAETVWLTQRAALVVSSRYHPLVFGTAAAVPCLGLHRDMYTRIKLQGALAQVGIEAWCLPAAEAEEGGMLPVLRRLWRERNEAREAMTRARAPLALQEERRWRRLLTRLGWLEEAEEALGHMPLGWPADRLAVAALGALALEQESGGQETGRWRGIVRNFERSVDLADRNLRVRRRTAMEASVMLSEQQWNDYSRDGFLHLGKVLEPEELEALRQRADDLALGNLRNPDVQMQLDTGGAYEALPEAVQSFERGTVLYRKIQGLETDDFFGRLVRHPLFLEICARQYGRHAAISIFRAMVMNKPAGQGTVLPWHQDGGNVWALDRDPLVTVWVALDPATRSNGCMEVVPGTHQLGLLSLYGSTVAEEDVARHCLPERVQPLEVEAGHAVLLHNWLIHRSGVNPSPVPRRAFTICYMDGRTKSVLTGDPFPLVAGSLPAEPYPYVSQLRESTQEAVAYARSLEEEVERLRQMREEAERYAKSLEAARESAAGASGSRPFLKRLLRRG